MSGPAPGFAGASTGVAAAGTAPQRSAGRSKHKDLSALGSADAAELWRDLAHTLPPQQHDRLRELKAGAYTRPLFSST
jgi:hypothetical protein